MKRKFFIGSRLAALALAGTVSFAVSSCGPSAYVLEIETRQPSMSGVDLVGKTISVVYLDNGDSADSLFAAEYSAAFASRLEEDYFGGDSLITMFCMQKDPGIDYSSKETMLGVLMDTGADVVFLSDSPDFGTAATEVVETDGTSMAQGSFPFSVNLYVYDSMDSRDTVLKFSGSSIARASAQVTGTESEKGVAFILKSSLGTSARYAGQTSGGKFAPGWRAEEIVFFLYESQDWYDTYFYVNDYKWGQAVEKWMEMLDTENLEKKACIEYNIAAACYLQGEYQLASDWLEMSRKDFQLPYASSLGQKISRRLAAE